MRFQADSKGQTRIFRVDIKADVKDGKLSPVTSGERSTRGFDINQEANVMVYSASDFRHLDDLYASDLNGQGERRLTRVNEKLWADLDLAGVERVPYKSTDGWDIEGFLVKPIGWQPDKKYPMILSIHGGPAGMRCV